MEEDERDLFEYIELFYNRKSLHSSLGYLSPVDYLIRPYNRNNKNKRIIIDKGIEYNCQKPYPEEKEKIISYLTEMISKNTDQRT